MGIRVRQGSPRSSVALRILLIMALISVTRFGAAQPGETVLDPLSETPFPVSLIPPGGASEQSLTGTGLREVLVLFFPVHVYAFGLYVEEILSNDAETRRLAQRRTLSQESSGCWVFLWMGPGNHWKMGGASSGP
ncbi:MAG: hypothetical protein OXC31_26105 [Spirochaetaceae bacterium]|nr:hypothetical protein [Spirochaetaceae bacterium]